MANLLGLVCRQAHLALQLFDYGRRMLGISSKRESIINTSYKFLPRYEAAVEAAKEARDFIDEKVSIFSVWALNAEKLLGSRNVPKDTLTSVSAGSGVESQGENNADMIKVLEAEKNGDLFLTFEGTKYNTPQEIAMALKRLERELKLADEKYEDQKRICADKKNKYAKEQGDKEHALDKEQKEVEVKQQVAKAEYDKLGQAIQTASQASAPVFV